MAEKQHAILKPTSSHPLQGVSMIYLFFSYSIIMMVFFLFDRKTNLLAEYACNLIGGNSADFRNENIWDMTLLCIPARTMFKFSPQVAVSTSQSVS